jgi:hypothetical protein
MGPQFTIVDGVCIWPSSSPALDICLGPFPPLPFKFNAQGFTQVPCLDAQTQLLFRRYVEPCSRVHDLQTHVQVLATEVHPQSLQTIVHDLAELTHRLQALRLGGATPQDYRLGPVAEFMHAIQLLEDDFGQG